MPLMKKRSYVIESKTFLTDEIVSMWIIADDIAKCAVPGQFVSIYCDSKSELLPRPISICDTDADKGLLRIVFRIAGRGTKEFAAKDKGDKLDIIGPLGNGYLDAIVSSNINADSKAIIIGGGIGIPPMLKLAKELKCNKSVVLGYRDFIYMNDEFAPYGDVFVSTEDGSVGTKGNVIDAIKNNGIEADVLFACGPIPMLRGLKQYADENGMTAWISLEEKMACGIGACLACVCNSTEIDSHSMVKNKRICKDGPIFNAKEVDFS